MDMLTDIALFTIAALGSAALVGIRLAKARGLLGARKVPAMAPVPHGPSHGAP